MMEKWFLTLLAFAAIFTADASDITDGTCYKDKLLSRLLSTSHKSGTNTPEECKKSCSKGGYKYAGVQYTNECWCGNAQPPASRIRDSSHCSSNCPGDAALKCGGYFSVNIYKTEKIEITDGTCYKDKYVSRIFPSSQSHTSRSNTPDECKRTCFEGGYKYAGVQFKKECWCGNETPPASRIRDSSQCFAKCPGDAKLKCGSILRMNIYKTDKTVSNSPPCGTTNEPKISGGIETAPNQYPWMIRIPIGKTGCGGSFITDRHILTAKHCMDYLIEETGGNWKEKTIKMSVHNQYDPDDYKEVPIKDYLWPEIEAVQDIAIITLERPVDLSDNKIGTVCLPANADEDYRGKEALAMGWGWTPETESQSVHLQELELTVADREEALWLFTNVVFQDGVPLDVCRGDSGGPLVHKEDGRWTVIGTVQGGGRCDDHSGGKGRWNKVTGHLQWIKSVIDN